MAITLVRQEYKFTEEQQDYRTVLGTIFGRQEIPMDIRKFKGNFKDRKLRYFNCNIYRYIAKEYRRPKKEKDTRKCYKYEQVGYITKDCITGQKMKNQNI